MTLRSRRGRGWADSPVAECCRRHYRAEPMPGRRVPKDRKRDCRRLVLAPAWAAVLVAVLAAVLAAPSEGWAENDRGVTVVLLRPTPARDLLLEAIVRIKSELSAGGFQVAVTEVPAASLAPEPSVLKEWAARVKPPSATLAVFGIDRLRAELWAVDRITGEATVRNVAVETSPDRPISEVLAIRAQELLRAMLVEASVEEKRPASPPPAAPPAASTTTTTTTTAAESPAQAHLVPWRLGLELGGAVFGGAGGLGTSVAAAARLRFALDERVWVRASAIGFGTNPRVKADLGSATVSQTFLLLEAAAWLRPGRTLRPMASLGVGGERFAVDGSADLPYRGEQNASWAFAADVGLGVSLRLAQHFELQLEMHALVAAPRPWVRLFDAEGGRAGQPTLLAVLTLAGGA
jgi:hypothetical protein